MPVSPGSRTVACGLSAVLDWYDASAGVGPRLYVTPPVEALERLDVTSWYFDVQLVGGDFGMVVVDPVDFGAMYGGA